MNLSKDNALVEINEQITKLNKAKKKYKTFDFKKEGLKMTAVDFFRKQTEIKNKLAALKKIKTQILNLKG